MNIRACTLRETTDKCEMWLQYRARDQAKWPPSRYRGTVGEPRLAEQLRTKYCRREGVAGQFLCSTGCQELLANLVFTAKATLA